MNDYIFYFLVFGCCFGIVSFPFRHLFSEGPTKIRAAGEENFLSGRIFWALVCTFLWPILILTGLNSAWILAKRRHKSFS